MLNFYINYPSWISPFVFPGGKLIRWYSLMYLVAFSIAYCLIHYVVKKNQCKAKINSKNQDDLNLVLCLAIALVIGARVGSCLIYSGTYYWKRPWLMFWPFDGGKFVGLPGMSFHGGIVGGLIGAILFSKKHKIKVLDITDLLTLTLPFGYTFGRLGNFFNAELYGKVARSGHGIIFPDAQTFFSGLEWVKEIANNAGINITGQTFVNLPRHPSQLYEALFEGVILGLIMWFIIRPRFKKLPSGFTTGLWLTLYGIFRFVIEYFRQPDEQMGYIFKWGKGSDNIYVFSSLLNISTGQILSFLMLLAGVLFIAFAFATDRVSRTTRTGKPLRRT